MSESQARRRSSSETLETARKVGSAKTENAELQARRRSSNTEIRRIANGPTRSDSPNLQARRSFSTNTTTTTKRRKISTDEDDGQESPRVQATYHYANSPRITPHYANSSSVRTTNESNDSLKVPNNNSRPSPIRNSNASAPSTPIRSISSNDVRSAGGGSAGRRRNRADADDRTRFGDGLGGMLGSLIVDIGRGLERYVPCVARARVCVYIGMRCASVVSASGRAWPN